MALIGIPASEVQTGKISRTVNLYGAISGYVTAVNGNIGKYVSPTDVLFEIANTSAKHIALGVFEKDVALLKIGQTIRFSLASESDYGKRGTIFLIGKDVAANSTVPVHVHRTNEKDALLVPGIMCKHGLRPVALLLLHCPSKQLYNRKERMWFL